MNRSSDYRAYIRYKIAILNQEIGLIRPLVVAHPPTVGAFYEAVLKQFLGDFVPNKFKIGTGFIMDIDANKMSRQVDILVYKDDNFPPIYRGQDVVIVESSSVYAAIEVKADINLTNMKKSRENLKSVQDVTYKGHTKWYLIGINARIKTEKLLAYRREFLGDSDGLLVLNRHYVEGDKLLQTDQATPTEVFLNNFLCGLMNSTVSPLPKPIPYR